MAYGNFGEAREAMLQVAYGMISFLTYWVNQQKDNTYEVEDIIVIPMEDEVIQDYDIAKVEFLKSTEGNLYIGMRFAYDDKVTWYDIKDLDNEYVMVILWNIFDKLYRRFD